MAVEHDDFIGLAVVGLRCMTQTEHVFCEVASSFVADSRLRTAKTLAKIANHISKTADRKPASYPAELAHVCSLAALAASDVDAVLDATELGEFGKLDAASASSCSPQACVLR